jgi:hypothetical protein
MDLLPEFVVERPQEGPKRGLARLLSADAHRCSARAPRETLQRERLWSPVRHGRLRDGRMQGMVQDSRRAVHWRGRSGDGEIGFGSSEVIRRRQCSIRRRDRGRLTDDGLAGDPLPHWLAGVKLIGVSKPRWVAGNWRDAENEDFWQIADQRVCEAPPAFVETPSCLMERSWSCPFLWGLGARIGSGA